MGDPQIDVAAILGFVRRRAGLILLVFVAFVSSASVIIQVLPPVYAATALVLVDPNGRTVLDDTGPGISPGSEHARIESEAEILRSDALLLDVVDAENLAEHPAFGGARSWRETAWAGLKNISLEPKTEHAKKADALAALRSATTIARRGLTYLIAIEVRSTDANLAAHLANTLARRHIETQIEAKVTASLTAIDVLQNRLTDTETALAGMSTATIAGTTADPFAAMQAERARLLARAGELETQAQLHIADSRIVSPALVPTGPTFPDALLVLTFAGAFGVLAGTGVALARDTLVGGFSTEAQAENLLRRRVVTTIPHMRTANPADLIGAAPLGIFAEAIRRIELALAERCPATDEPIRQANLVAVTSSVAGEGKSLVALSLARTLAATGKQVLLIDCDLRQSQLRQRNGCANRPGLGRFLENAKTGMLAIDPLLDRDPASTVTVIYGDSLDDTATGGLLTGSVFRQLLAAARSSFDVVVIDTPAIARSADALHLAAKADNIVYVIAADRTPQSDVHRGLDRLSGTIAPHTQILLALNVMSGRTA